MSTKDLTETEVKISLQHLNLTAVQTLLQASGMQTAVPRAFEVNAVYDTPDNQIRGAQMLLRLRRVGGRNVLTWKGPPIPGPHKSRPEIETQFDSFEALNLILGHLGYVVSFRYEKYRTEYKSPSGEGTVTLDETPIGNYLELEGDGAWIDQFAAQLGFKPTDYLLDSYGKLYLSYCSEIGMQPSHMTFASYTK